MANIFRLAVVNDAPVLVTGDEVARAVSGGIIKNHQLEVGEALIENCLKRVFRSFSRL